VTDPYQAIGLVPTMWEHDEYRSEVLEPQIRKLTERGICAPPDGDA
jgi:hypothetical protein